MSLNGDQLQDILSHVADKCNLKNWRYQIKKPNETIETYFGVLIPLTVIGFIEDEEIIEHVYVKLPTADEAIREFSGYMWDTEAYIYNTFVPVWKSLSNMNVDELIPTCYYANSMENCQTLVLKDMRCEGFQIYARRYLDFEHVVVSLRSLAQFHALSFIIRKDHEDAVVSLLKPYTDVYPSKLNMVMLNTFRAHSHLFKGTKYEQYWEYTLANYKVIVADSTSKAKCLIYGHGDYWKENIMYKYKANNPVKACMFDFQSCRVMTPAFDFLFFILNSTNGNLRQQHYNSFVQEYYGTFRNSLFNHGIQLELLYTQEDFISDLKIVASVCFIRICLAFSLWLGLENNSVIKSKNLLETDQERNKELCYFKEILIDAMEDLCNYGYISL